MTWQGAKNDCKTDIYVILHYFSHWEILCLNLTLRQQFFEHSQINDFTIRMQYVHVINVYQCIQMYHCVWLTKFEDGRSWMVVTAQKWMNFEKLFEGQKNLKNCLFSNFYRVSKFPRAFIRAKQVKEKGWEIQNPEKIAHKGSFSIFIFL